MRLIDGSRRRRFRFTDRDRSRPAGLTSRARRGCARDVHEFSKRSSAPSSFTAASHGGAETKATSGTIRPATPFDPKRTLEPSDWNGINAPHFSRLAFRACTQKRSFDFSAIFHSYGSAMGISTRLPNGMHMLRLNKLKRAPPVAGGMFILRPSRVRVPRESVPRSLLHFDPEMTHSDVA